MPRAARHLRIAIDGPAGAGKSTLAESLARTLELPYVNTGLMYRALAERAIREGIDPGDGSALARVARRIAFSMGGGRVPTLVIDGAAPPSDLRSPIVEAVVSRVAAHPVVREILRRRQRELGEGGCVMEGRDIGTVVLPAADVKIFLAAESSVRAGRRARERGVRSGSGVAAEVEKAVAARDALDGRTNPLVPAPDAHVLDSTRLDRSAMLAAALDIVRRSTAAGP